MFNRLTDHARTLFLALWFTLPYIIIVGVTAIVLLYFNQTLELYRAFAQDVSLHIRHILTAIVMLCVLTFLTWHIIKNTMESELAAPRRAHAVFTWHLRIFPCIAVALPVATVFGLLTAARGDPAATPLPGANLSELFEGLASRTHLLQISAVVIAVFGGLFLLAALTRGDRLDAAPIRKIVSYKSFPLGLLLYVIFALIIFIWPISVSRFFGAIALILLFMTCLILLVRYLYHFSPYTNAAVLSILVIWVSALWTTGRNDYTITPRSVTERLYKDTPEAFQDWLSARKDRNSFPPGTPYPVFLVAASGGGLYSARHTALTLARFQDRCPSFAQHVFAISGISGGSWGAAIFNRLAHENAPNGEGLTCDISTQDPSLRPKGAFELKTEALLEDDFLSPLVGVGLFPNMFQAALPVSVTRLNRSAIFERVIEEPWKGKTPENPFQRTVESSWQPDKSGGALLLNMTDADRGYQVVAAPFNVRSNRRQDESAFELVEKFLNEPPPQDGATSQEPEPLKVTKDLTISSAVAMSAGFPIVIGAGFLKETRGNGKVETMRLVDGGYYENSGVETLMQIIDQLRDPEVVNAEISIHVIILDSHYSTERKPDTLLTPIKAVLKTRSVRSQVAITNLYADRNLAFIIKDMASNQCRPKNRTPNSGPLDDACEAVDALNSPGADGRFGNLRPIQVSLDLSSFAVPLAFYLSRNAKVVVDGFSGDRFCDTASRQSMVSRREATAAQGPASDPDRAAALEMQQRLICGNANLCRGLKLLGDPTALGSLGRLR
jgi:hypothetical protein